MKTLFYKYPTTIGEELKLQIKYCKSLGIIKNNSELSLKMRELEKEIFGKERKYTTLEERENNGIIDRTTKNERPSTMNDLFKITLNKEISNYLLLFSSFKALNIIKEDSNIIELLDYYRITPKKEIDKKRLEDIRNNGKEKNVMLCCECKERKKRLRCENYKQCVFRKIYNRIKKLDDADTQIKILYKLGFPSNWLDIIQWKNSYIISLKGLKNILGELEQTEKINFIKNLENQFEQSTDDFLKKAKKRQEFWKRTLEKTKIKINELENTKDVKKLQDLKFIKIYYNYNKPFSQPYTSIEKEKIPNKQFEYYKMLIEDECGIKKKMPIKSKTIH